MTAIIIFWRRCCWLTAATEAHDSHRGAYVTAIIPVGVDIRATLVYFLGGRLS